MADLNLIDKVGQKTKRMKLWWLNPIKLLLGFLFPLYVLFCYYPFNSSGGAMYDAPNYINDEVFLYGLSFFLFFCIGYFISFKRKIKQSVNTVEYISPKFLTAIGVIAILAYIIWFNWLVLNPGILLDQMSGNRSFRVKSVYSTISGVTTLSQLGVLYVCIYLFNNHIFKQKKLNRLLFYTIILFSFIRAVIWSERLALIEIIIPIGLIYLKFGGSDKLLKRFRQILPFLPYIGILFLIVFFAFFEYFRSWSYYQNYYDNVIEFATERVFLYYYTAINTAAAVLTYTNWPSYSFDSYLNWVYEFPVLGEMISKNIEPFGDWVSFLNKYSDPEFNNPTGFLKPFWDSGVIGALIYALIWGAFTKFAYRGFKASYGLGKYIFPVFYISVLEFLRVPYIGSTRVFPIILFAVIGYLFFRKRIFLTDAVNDNN